MDGEIFAMAGESGVHADISVNLVGIMANQLKGTPCRARSKDTKVRSGPQPKPGRQASGLYSYPDLVVVCGEPRYHDDYTDVILNPTVIVEVLSPATEAFGRGEKFTRYQRWNHTLTDYLLVSQNQAQIEHYCRQPDGTWSYRCYTGLKTTVSLPSVACCLPLAEVYYRIRFPVKKTSKRGSKRVSRK